MFLSVFDMFKVGIGPSSSHTMGPMVAAGMFLDLLRNSPFEPAGVRARLHGSLAFTGVGHIEMLHGWTLSCTSRIPKCNCLCLKMRS